MADAHAARVPHEEILLPYYNRRMLPRPERRRIGCLPRERAAPDR
jgi:hypothetical protein